MKGIGTGRVLKTTSQDDVFFFLSDHGSPNTFYFPGFAPLVGSDIINALTYMHD